MAVCSAYSLVQPLRCLMKMNERPSIFLSYSSEDKYFAKKLVTDLRMAEVRVWFDQGEIKLGDSLIEKKSEWELTK